MTALDLLDYRRRVAGLYRNVRENPDPRAAWLDWRHARQQLFATHPESPWDEADRVARRLEYFPYRRDWRRRASVQPLEDPQDRSLGHSGGGSTGSRAIGTVSIETNAGVETLTLFWLTGYGGGLFLPFQDATSGTATYGGGRYLLDTAKGADLGGAGDELVLDFNYAYHPSCVHSARWSCPLTPTENRLSTPVEAGERLP